MNGELVQLFHSYGLKALMLKPAASEEVLNEGSTFTVLKLTWTIPDSF